MEKCHIVLQILKFCHCLVIGRSWYMIQYKLDNEHYELKAESRIWSNWCRMKQPFINLLSNTLKFKGFQTANRFHRSVKLLIKLHQNMFECSCTTVILDFFNDLIMMSWAGPNGPHCEHLHYLQFLTFFSNFQYTQ